MPFKSDEFISNLNKRDPEGLDKNGEPWRILVVDDSMVMRRIIIQFLKSEMYEIVGEATNGQEAVELYRETRPDLVTLDINMPVKDGLTALQEILGIDPGARVVMLTSESEQDMVIKAVQNGARNYVVKPPERATLLAKIKAALAPRN